MLASSFFCMSFEAPQTKENIEGAVVSDTQANASENRSTITYTLIAFGLALLVRIFVASPYLVSGPSMEETFHNHDYLIVQNFAACVPLTSKCVSWGAPKRGDVIVFRLPSNSSQTLIKRVIGLPGETINIDGTRVIIKNEEHPEGFELPESYVVPQDAGGPTGNIVTLSSNEYFVLGDNRHVSYDSRSWGALPKENIVGRVLLRLYPFGQIDAFPGEARY